MSRTIPARGRWLLAVMLFLPVGAWAIGCGSSSSSVSGKVSYRGQPLRGGTVTFYGANQWTGSSHIGKDGSYTIARVPPGQIQIAVETQTVKPNPMAKRMPKPPKDAPVKGSMYDSEAVANRYVAIPAQYADKDRSALTYQATNGKQTHIIELR